MWFVNLLLQRILSFTIIERWIEIIDNPKTIVETEQSLLEGETGKKRNTKKKKQKKV